MYVTCVSDRVFDKDDNSIYISHFCTWPSYPFNTDIYEYIYIYIYIYNAMLHNQIHAYKMMII